MTRKNMTRENKMQMLVDDMEVLVSRKRVKHVRFAVHPPDGEVRLTVPFFLGTKKIQDIIRAERAWIEKKQAVVAAQPRPAPKIFAEDEIHPYLGEDYRLNVIRANKKPSVSLEKDHILRLQVPLDASPGDCEKILTEWYRKQMKMIVPPLIEKWEQRTGLAVQTYGIKRMKTRWGTCNPQHRRIWLSLDLIKKPPICLDYVIVHEMVHFWERLHNKNFTRHMDRIMPDWRDIKKQLNNIA